MMGGMPCDIEDASGEAMAHAGLNATSCRHRVMPPCKVYAERTEGDMYIHSRAASLAFKLVVALMGTSALLYEIGFGYGYFRVTFLFYFTNLSNMAVVAYLWSAIIAALRDPALWPRPYLPKVKHALMLAITVTWLVAHFLLDGGSVFKDGTFHWTMLVVHYIVPIAMILDWLLFDVKGTMRKGEPPTWLAFPLVYFAYVMVLVWGFGLTLNPEAHSRWPYGFLDFDALGVRTVTITVLVMIVVFLTLGYVYVLIDHLMEGTGKTKEPLRH